MPTAKRIPAAVELIFDLLYLCIGGILGFYLLTTADGSLLRQLYGVMSLVLIFGDSFHLIPRMRSSLSPQPQRFAAALGMGKMITSITMTGFYLLLWQIGLLRFPGTPLSTWTPLVYALAAVRVFLCLCPQNRWIQPDAPQRWNIYRNIPFVLLGGVVTLLFLLGDAPADPALGWMWLAIVISFGCYLPVVLGSHKYPLLGMLMLPKTCAYLWIICMGLLL